MDALTALCVGTMFGVGVYQLLRRNVIRSAIGLVIIGNAINLFLLAAGAYDGPVLAYTTLTGVRADALPQALILTAIVISMGGFSFVLGLVYIASVRYRTADLDELSELKN